jgi:hypothetical protein
MHGEYLFLAADPMRSRSLTILLQGWQVHQHAPGPRGTGLPVRLLDRLETARVGIEGHDAQVLECADG